MELNINFKIDVTERTSACVATLTQLLQRMADVSAQTIQKPATSQAVEEAREEPRQQAQEQQVQEQKPPKARTAPKTTRKTSKTEAESATAEPAQEPVKAESAPEAKQTDIPAENPETAKNVGNDMPMDDGSRKEEIKEGKEEEQNETQSRDELISAMRKAMNDCMSRFIGPDYKNQTNTATYKKYNGMLRTHFMRLASTLAANGDYHLKPNETMKPSMLNEKDLKSFIAEVDLLVPDPKTGEITKRNFF